ncbi:MAG TPA: hypothetical protein VFY71_13445, partial [Planctomycetota bacterium]|nr:hypothetical protein [Planctomycetota bacterium]
MRAALAAGLVAALLSGRVAAQVPPGTSWIWTSGRPAKPDERAWFAAEFRLEHAPRAAQLSVAADNHAQIWLDGELLGVAEDWHEPLVLDVAGRLAAGRHVLAIAASNEGGRAALLAFLVADGEPVLRADAHMHAFSGEPTDWPRPAGGATATVIAPYGAQPWGLLAWSTGRTLLPAEGFTCEEVASGFGSLIALELSPDGEPVVSVENGSLLTLHDADGDGRFEGATPFCTELRVCQGLCFDGADAWATGVGPNGPGFYHLPAGDTPRHAELVAAVTGSIGEHGPHAVVPGPDGRLWIMLGNHVQLGAPFAKDSPVQLIYEGHVLPRIVDPNGHATEIAAPGGTIVAYDRATGAFTLQADGFRNCYDMAFAPSGDLFTFDSDMEWDIGLPWYRPTRVVHVLPGGDYGWRTGSADWPAWYPDSLPPVMDLGRGSPTGVAWCDSPAFPAAWRGTLLLGDWSQGRILAVHLTPDGITYRGRSDVLLAGRPLPVTDLVFDRDGALLVSVGGRGARGALLRLRGTAEAIAQPAPADSGFRASARPPVMDASTPLDELVELLGCPDRWVRWIAAREIERRSQAADYPLQGLFGASASGSRETGGELMLVAARICVARHDVETGRFLASLMAPEGLSAGQPLQARLCRARAIEVALLAGGSDTIAGTDQPPDPEIGASLLRHFPSGSPPLDRELAALLARTEPEGARAVLLAALEDEPSADGAISLLYALSALRGAATVDETRPALERISALRGRPGGNSYQGYLDAIERRLIAQAPAAERAALRDVSRPAPIAPMTLASGAPPRDVDRVRAYVAETLDAPERSASEGALVFAHACAACHTRGEFAGRGGPDLAAVGARLSLDDLLTAMLQPSRDVSDQYRSTRLTLRDGRDLTGLVLRDDGADIELLAGVAGTQTVHAADVAERSFCKLSAMP